MLELNTVLYQHQQQQYPQEELDQMIMKISNNSTFQQSDKLQFQVDNDDDDTKLFDDPINYIPPNPFIDPYFTLEDFSSTSSSSYNLENYMSTEVQQHFSSSSSSPLNQQLSEIFQPPSQNDDNVDDILLGFYNNNQNPNKRLKSSFCTDYLVNNPYYYDSMFNSSFAEYPSMNSYLKPSNLDILPQGLFFPSTGIPITMGIDIPALAYSGGCDNQTMASASSVKKPNESGEGLSAQSVAARQRRRKITEKTQELGKLIPGGNKMNTAEMFHAASKYVKYLQAQVGILQLLTNQENQDEKAETKGNNKWELQMQVLLASSTIQEKLYLKEKCLVPKDFVETLSKDTEIISNQTVSMDIESLVKLELAVQLDGEKTLN